MDGKEIGIQGIKEDMKSRIRVHDECEEMVLEKKKREKGSARMKERKR